MTFIIPSEVNYVPIMFFHSEIPAYHFQYPLQFWRSYAAPHFQVTINKQISSNEQNTFADSLNNQQNGNIQTNPQLFAQKKIFSQIKCQENHRQKPKLIHYKTKDLMRPFSRMLYSFFQKLVKSSQVLECQKKQIKAFNTRVDELRSKQPCKFTQLIISFMKTASQSLRVYVQQFVNGCQFSGYVLKSGYFKHWKDKSQLVCFFRHFICNNKGFLKPTKYYSSHFVRRA